MKKYILVTVFSLISSFSYSQNCNVQSPVAVGVKLVAMPQTFVGYGVTASQAVANTGGTSLGKVVADFQPIQMNNGIWISRRIVDVPTLTPVYSASSIQKFINSANNCRSLNK